MKKIFFRQICMTVWCVAAAGAAFAQNWNPNHKIGTVDGNYSFNYTQTPSQMVEIYAAAVPNTGLSYQWQQCATPEGTFTNISGATSSSYTLSGPLSQTMYYRRKTTHVSSGNFIFSNVIKISMVSVNWEDYNYVREHDVRTSGLATWHDVDQLAIGPKLQTTTYMDGLGRVLEKISRETVVPSSGTLWGDVVQFAEYDAYGRMPKQQLPYTTTTQSGKFKTGAATDQPSYYSANYSETYPYSQPTFDNSPLNRVLNVKSPGASWAAGSGNSVDYDMNTATDNVQRFHVDYVAGDAPVNDGAYAANKLLKTSYTDENGKLVVIFTDFAGHIILKKVQLDNTPSGVYTGWICTYNVYDEMGQLRFEIQPEGVSYLAANSWSFSGTAGAQVLAGQCFQYDYDDKGRLTWKKTPDAAPMRMLYDARDRLVFAQDGNQAALATPQWTASLYDELDRLVVTTLYNTSSSVSTLQSNINGASGNTSITVSTSANNGGTSVSFNAYATPLTSTDLNSSSTTTVVKYFFYDTYSFANVKSFNTGYSNLTAYSTSDPDVQPIAVDNRTLGMATGSKVRVLGSNDFLNSTVYYDLRGSMIQALSDNIKAGVDIATTQYHFDGRVLSTCDDHSATSTGYTNFQILTKYVADKLGRVASIGKKFGSNAMKTVSAYDYDDLGRLKTKHFDPGYTDNGGTELESLNYSFNLHGQLTGINKDYALKDPTTYDKWGHFFGLYLGYDDASFEHPQLTGQIGGVIWNTQGDDAQRKYDYTYDNAGRLINADFHQKEHTSDSWDNSMLDYSTGGYTGKITYDLNGNIASMLHKGVLPGSAPMDIDDLRYVYKAHSNKLETVTDQMSNTSVNGSFGDFVDGSNTSTPDYVYDDNGNVVIDLNKDAKDIGSVTGANGIHYNFLDKPDEIHLYGKGTILITYSGDGEKLKRVFQTESAAPTKSTVYIHEFVYEETGNTDPSVLAYIGFEEGRVRVVTPTSQADDYDELEEDGTIDLPNDIKGVFDFFVKDHQQNTRMVLTDEVHVVQTTCSMETSRSTQEEAIFGQQGSGNEVMNTRQSASITGWTNPDIGSYVSWLNGADIGPNTLQKVMAGDHINVNVLYWHYNDATPATSNIPDAVASSLLQILSTPGSPGVGALVNKGVSDITTNLPLDAAFSAAVQPATYNTLAPQGFLTVLFFDERFKLVDVADGGVLQQQVDATVTSAGSSITLSGRAPKNGYVYVFVSNMGGKPVVFDNLKVHIAAGNIVEENHYYPFGLKVASISSQKFYDSYAGVVDNHFKMQGSFSEMDDDIGWNDFELRNYDPQIGRWVQQDPYQQCYSPYVGMGNDPVNLIDPTGGIYIPPLGQAAEYVQQGGEMATLVITSSHIASLGGKSISALQAAIKIGGIVAKSLSTVNILTTAINTNQVGNGFLIEKQFDSKGKFVSLKVTGTIFLYGEQASESMASEFQNNINYFFNSVTAMVNGKTETKQSGINFFDDYVPITFDLKVKYTNNPEAERDNNVAENINFLYVYNGDDNISGSRFHHNSAVVDLCQNAERNGTSLYHEIAHMMGLMHYQQQNSDGLYSIMYAQTSLNWRENLRSRVLTQRDLDALNLNDSNMKFKKTRSKTFGYPNASNTVIIKSRDDLKKFIENPE